MRKQSTGLIALAVIGAFYAFRNRYRIQQFVESLGIRTPTDKSNFVDETRSVVSKAAGRTEHAMHPPERVNEMVSEKLLKTS